MSDQNNKTGAAAGEQANPATAEAQQPAAAAASSPVEDLQAQLAAAQVEVALHKDAFLRAHAEAENTRKRVERELANARKYALESFANELLGVCDSLELGLDAAGHASADVDKLKEGMELTYRQLLKVFEQHRIVAINPLGETFNPEQHQAITMQESAEHPPNTVISVMQKGYCLNERVLRPAMVIVAKPPAVAVQTHGADDALEA